MEETKKAPNFEDDEKATIVFTIGNTKPVEITLSKGRAKVLCKSICKRYDWKYQE